MVTETAIQGLATHYSASEAGARLVQTVRAHRDWVAGVGQVRGQLSVLSWHEDLLAVRTMDSYIPETLTQSWSVAGAG